MNRFLTGLAMVVMYSQTVFATTRYQCTPRQAEKEGYFECLTDCDENHYTTGVYGPKKYCLNYFPNEGNCYMKPYTKPDILSCGGKAGGQNPPMWIILIGGSNNYMMLKTLLDEMLDLPGTAGYDPKTYWNAQFKTADGQPPYGEMALMDFIWDKNGNTLRKTAYWWGDSMTDAVKTQSIFLDVPAPAAGQVRISYLNIHTADKFQDRFNRIAKPGSPWLAAKPRIMVWEEWSGIWDDADTPQSVHEGNIQYMKNRQASEGLNIVNYVFTDSGPDCTGWEQPQMQAAKAALNSVPTSFPKYYFSKQNMVYGQYKMTTKCMAFQGHTVEPMNIVFWNRYFNLVCNSDTPKPYEALIPACVDLGDNTNTDKRCFSTAPNNKWMDSIMQVCLLDHRMVHNGPASAGGTGCQVRMAENQEHTQKRRVCKLQHVNVVNAGDVEEGEEEHAVARPNAVALESLMRHAVEVDA